MGTLTINTLPFTINTTGLLPPFSIGTVQTGSTYTFQLADAQTIIPFNSSSAQTATIPPSVFPVGTQLSVVQMGVGVVNILGPGVTIQPAAEVVTASQFAFMGVLQISSGVWIAIGVFTYAAP